MNYACSCFVDCSLGLTLVTEDVRSRQSNGLFLKYFSSFAIFWPKFSLNQTCLHCRDHSPRHDKCFTVFEDFKNVLNQEKWMRGNVKNDQKN